MRLKVVLDLKAKTINVAYLRALQAYIYTSLGELIDVTNLHDNGFKEGKQKFKLFTFSEIYSDSISFNKETKELSFNEEGYFVFTSYIDELVKILNERIITTWTVCLFGINIKVKSCSIINDEVERIKNKVVFETISPVTCYGTEIDGTKNYYYPDTIEFRNSVINNIIKKYRLCYGEDPINFRIDKIFGVKEKIVKFKDIYLNAYHFNIVFENLDTKLINVINRCGIGSKNSAGFGMMEIKQSN